MKKLFLLILSVAFILCSCNKISDKPISEKLNIDELSKAIKSDTLFATFYEYIREEVDDMSDIKKATYNDISYRRLFKYIKYIQDTIYWNPLHEKWEKEWESEYGRYLPKADSVLDYWKQYLAENSLDKYVKIELAHIDKEYYDYIGGLKEVHLGFILTPLQGTIEQIRFNYGYMPKINDDSKYYEKHNCISTSPFSSPTIRYWEVSYSDKDNFAGKNVETFLRDYNLYIEVTNIRKDGVNNSTDDFNIPKKVSECLKNEKDYPFLFKLNKDKLIKEMINKDYLQKWEYQSKQADNLKEKKDKLCFDFFLEVLLIH
ncbi:MAG: hypothetical protein LBH92_08660 [Bacteroidales bacterium]|jgi:hypothetical protein|nr:hypothetical protein [Bacteroidales bacterium]